MHSPKHADGMAPDDWWRHAVIYEIYIRSFADSNGDGVGDIGGIRSRLPYLADLGIDAIWITPWYTSPMADGGYDVQDFRSIAAEFGNLSDAEHLIKEAHELGLRVIIDIVPNHTSIQHPWFVSALASESGSFERNRYWFRSGHGPDGDKPPNDWISVFGGPAWSRSLNDKTEPKEWYLHLFAPEQPDLNWVNNEVRTEFESILRFWLDRGVDGFRVDVAHGLSKDPSLPNRNLGEKDIFPGMVESAEVNGNKVVGDHPFWDREENHPIFRAWRSLLDSYSEKERSAKILLGEVWRVHQGGLPRYLRKDELHLAFNFDFLKSSWNSSELRENIDRHLKLLASVGATATWVLSTHDFVRHVSRYGKKPGRSECRTDVEVGTRRARAAALLVLALPGVACLYQGEELGLPEVENLPPDVLKDPMWERSGHQKWGRDGCRVPLPWSDAKPGFGFSPVTPWLPQPPEWGILSVAAQDHDARSMLTLYRQALNIRHALSDFKSRRLSWIESPEGIMLFRRGEEVMCMINFTADPFPLPVPNKILLTSGPLQENLLPRDTAVWLQRSS